MEGVISSVRLFGYQEDEAGRAPRHPRGAVGLGRDRFLASIGMTELGGRGDGGLIARATGLRADSSRWEDGFLGFARNDGTEGTAG